MKIIRFLFFILIPFSLSAQHKTEKEVILNHEFQKPEYNKRHVEYIFKHSNNVLVKYNPVSLTLGGLMYVYQKYISQVLGTNCPYEVSCSAFSVSALKRYGIIKGVALSADRLTRCNSFSAMDLTEDNYNQNTMRIMDPLENYK